MPPSRGGSPSRKSASTIEAASSSKRKRKAIKPQRAPSKRDDLPTTPSVNVSLLLRALLREAERDPNNLRHPAPAPPTASTSSLSTSTSALSAGESNNNSSSRVIKRRERDLLPPPQAGYGRGKRSTSAALSATEYDLGDASTSPSTVSPATTTNGNSDKKLLNRMIGRSRSIEPSSTGADPAESSNGMARASSLGPSSHYNRPHVLAFHHQPYQHQPSPLIHQAAVMQTPPAVEQSLPSSPLAPTALESVPSFPVSTR